MTAIEKVKKYWYVFAAVILAVVLIAWLTSCGGGGRDIGSSNDDGVYRGKMWEYEKLTTPKGAIIASRTKIDPSYATLVDAGLEDVNRIASAPPNNYDVSDIPPSRYKIWLFPRSPKCENPGFLIDATGSPYEGSEWDKDPSPTRCLLCAAGLTAMQGLQAENPGMVIAEDSGHMRTIVRYEAEHSILWYKDPGRYVETQYHTNGTGHPILGEGPGVGLRSQALAFKTDVKVEGSDACALVTK